jgi:hypothetical protein
MLSDYKLKGAMQRGMDKYDCAELQTHQRAHAQGGLTSQRLRRKGVDLGVLSWYNKVKLKHRYADSVPASSKIEAVTKAEGAPW